MLCVVQFHQSFLEPLLPAFTGDEIAEVVGREPPESDRAVADGSVAPLSVGRYCVRMSARSLYSFFRAYTLYDHSICNDLEGIPASALSLYPCNHAVASAARVADSACIRVTHPDKQATHPSQHVVQENGIGGPTGHLPFLPDFHRCAISSNPLYEKYRFRI